jgi:hypothetical protein
LVVVFQKGMVDYVGFVFDFNFAIFEAWETALFISLTVLGNEND